MGKPAGLFASAILSVVQRIDITEVNLNEIPVKAGDEVKIDGRKGWIFVAYVVNAEAKTDWIEARRKNPGTRAVGAVRRAFSVDRVEAMPPKRSSSRKKSTP